MFDFANAWNERQGSAFLGDQKIPEDLNPFGPQKPQGHDGCRIGLMCRHQPETLGTRHGLSAPFRAEFGEYVFDVRFHGFRSDVEVTRDFLV
jgi:hypothetical protein